MRSLREQIAEKCIHFTGIMQKTCEKGMVYDEVDKDLRLPYRVGLPCFLKTKDKYDDALEGRPKCHCPHVEFPSDEEVQRQLDEHDKHMKKMSLALEALDPIRKQYKGKNHSGVIECPVCKGQLHFTHAACNGHVHARCETKDCVSWME